MVATDESHKRQNGRSIHLFGSIMRKTTIILLILLAVCMWFAWVALQPVGGLPKVSITFLGYTNDATGTRLATIAVANLSASTIYLYRPLIEIPDTTEPAGLAYDQSHRPLSWHSTLDRGASDKLTISLPTNQSPWKLTLLVEPDVGVAGNIRRTLTDYHRMPYHIEGDWMEAKK